MAFFSSAYTFGLSGLGFGRGTFFLSVEIDVLWKKEKLERIVNCTSGSTVRGKGKRPGDFG